VQVLVSRLSTFEKVRSPFWFGTRESQPAQSNLARTHWLNFFKVVSDTQKSRPTLFVNANRTHFVLLHRKTPRIALKEKE
jgi:hypothetical protein